MPPAGGVPGTGNGIVDAASRAVSNSGPRRAFTECISAAAPATMGAEKLVLLTDIAGILDKDKKLIHELAAFEVERAIADGTVSGGMIPKVRSCIDALDGGVGSVHVIDGRVPHALLLEIFTDRGVGTVIRR